MSKDILSLNEAISNYLLLYILHFQKIPPTNESAVTVIDELAVSISNI